MKVEVLITLRKTFIQLILIFFFLDSENVNVTNFCILKVKIMIYEI